MHEGGRELAEVVPTAFVELGFFDTVQKGSAISKGDQSLGELRHWYLRMRRLHLGKFLVGWVGVDRCHLAGDVRAHALPGIGGIVMSVPSDGIDIIHVDGKRFLNWPFVEPLSRT